MDTNRLQIQGPVKIGQAISLDGLISTFCLSDNEFAELTANGEQCYCDEKGDYSSHVVNEWEGYDGRPHHSIHHASGAVCLSEEAFNARVLNA